MPLLEDHTASFIVRIWRELGESAPGSQEWRGSIEHVQSGKKVFFRELKAIAEFMEGPLAEIGINAPLRFWESMMPYLDSGASEDTDTPSEPISKKDGRQGRR
jgi:hypothetical protein